MLVELKNEFLEVFIKCLMLLSDFTHSSKFSVFEASRIVLFIAKGIGFLVLSVKTGNSRGRLRIFLKQDACYAPGYFPPSIG